MFEKLVETINNTGKAVGEKTKQGTDIVKTNLKITTEEKALTELYCEIGRKYYENNRNNPCCDTMRELFEKADEKTELIESLKAQVRALRRVNVCEVCGAEIPDDNAFCGKCGAKINRPDPVTIEENTPSEEVIDHEDTVEVTGEDGGAAINIEVVKNDSADPSAPEGGYSGYDNN
ncbi:MAG: zinc ribbon domain-containing protein [Ruminococcus sp.]|nr:zinc ribbon domain-containing protein [Ruminococcus sp.]